MKKLRTHVCGDSRIAHILSDLKRGLERVQNGTQAVTAIGIAECGDYSGALNLVAHLMSNEVYDAARQLEQLAADLVEAHPELRQQFMRLGLIEDEAESELAEQA